MRIRKCKYCGITDNLFIFPSGRIISVCINHKFLYDKDNNIYQQSRKKCKYCINDNKLLKKVGNKILPCCEEHYELYTKEITEKIKKTKLQKYGNENYANNEKQKQTNLKKYGVESTNSLDFVKDKKKKVWLNNLGVDHPSKSDIIKNKKEQTNLEKIGYKSPFESPEIQKQIKQTNLKLYGAENPFQSEICKNKIKQTNLKKYGVEYNTQDLNILYKVLSKFGLKHYKNTELTYQTKPELRFIEKCISENTEIQNGDRIPYYFNGKIHYYFCDFKIKDKITNQWRLIEIKAKHKWYYEELESGQFLAKVKATQEFSLIFNYLPYKILFNF